MKRSEFFQKAAQQMGNTIEDAELLFGQQLDNAGFSDEVPDDMSELLLSDIKPAESKRSSKKKGGLALRGAQPLATQPRQQSAIELPPVQSMNLAQLNQKVEEVKVLADQGDEQAKNYLAVAFQHREVLMSQLRNAFAEQDQRFAETVAMLPYQGSIAVGTALSETMQDLQAYTEASQAKFADLISSFAGGV